MLRAFAAYLVLHLLAYVLRVRQTLRSEKGIFLYHFVSAVITGLAGVVYVWAGSIEPRLAEAVLAWSIHGIYSMSFLELWSLAQGGYSLSVLRDVASAQTQGLVPDFSRLEQIGATKQSDRLAGLEGLGLVTRMSGPIALTRRGACVAFLLDGMLRWIDPEYARSGRL